MPGHSQAAYFFGTLVLFSVSQLSSRRAVSMYFCATRSSLCLRSVSCVDSASLRQSRAINRYSSGEGTGALPRSDYRRERDRSLSHRRLREYRPHAGDGSKFIKIGRAEKAPRGAARPFRYLPVMARKVAAEAIQMKLYPAVIPLQEMGAKPGGAQQLAPVYQGGWVDRCDATASASNGGPQGSFTLVVKRERNRSKKAAPSRDERGRKLFPR
jgi:hypothetical protein